ncbi:vigilin-like [Penaeus chinensis]|uniref:vigilin-like n=1 Tax=Penaeus chinensis TaxID=139456 RepID=UPI001FB6265E|nr:vigilin-like [Penaeus chinensis]
MECFVHGNKDLRMPIEIPVDLQPLMKAKQAPGIWLEMPSREEEPSESCTLVGKAKDRTQMLKTLEEIQQQLRNQETASPDIAPEHYGKAVGKNGDRLKYIQKKYNVRVTVPKDESAITIWGHSESVRDAIKELEELVQQDVLKQRVFLPVNILPEDIGFAIGKGGSHATKVNELFGLVVEGPLDEAQKAVVHIEQYVAERHRLNEERAEEQRRREEMMGTFPVHVEPNQVGKIIGKGGFRIRYIASKFNVNVQLPEQKDGAILVSGLKENAELAATAFEVMATRKLLPDHVLVPLRIKREDNLIVLGPEGCRAPRIERDFGIKLVRPSMYKPMMVEGDVQAVTDAVAFIEQMVADRLQALEEEKARRY